MYETKSLSLENVDAMYQEPNLKAWRSNQWTPPGYLDRKTRDDSYWQRRESVVEGGNGVTALENAGENEKAGTPPPKYDADEVKMA